MRRAMNRPMFAVLDTIRTVLSLLSLARNQGVDGDGRHACQVLFQLIILLLSMHAVTKIPH